MIFSKTEKVGTGSLFLTLALFAAAAAIASDKTPRDKRRAMQPKPRGAQKVPAVGEVRAIPKPETMKEIVMRIYERIGRDNLTLVAAGIAFYAMTAIFPALAATVSLYGLVSDPHTIQEQVATFGWVLPASSLKLITDSLQSFTSKPSAGFSIALIISLGLAIWSAKAGISALMTGLNIANEETERRSFIRQQLVALALTAGGIVFGILAIASIAVIPAVIALVPLSDSIKLVLGLGRWPLLLVVLIVGFAVIYRYGPDRIHARWRWITWGSTVATALWLIGSAGFSFYVSKFGSYDATYGSLAAVVVLLLWFWVGSLAVLIGAEIDAELQYANGTMARPLPPNDPKLADA